MPHHLLLRADARRLPLADRSVHCVVTSPPYYGLRDYSTGRWEGGDPGCDHKTPAKPPRLFYNGSGELYGSTCQSWSARDVSTVYRDACGKCGARRVDRQIGLEPTPGDYLDAMVRVFREVKRVLRDDGTCWVNLGDSYAQSEIRHRNGRGSTLRDGDVSPDESWNAATHQTGRRPRHGLKPKDLLGIPWRVAFALQADGWYLRSDLIWAKPNPMPESVTDRPTKSHEYVFLLSKRGRYFYDAEAVRQESSPTNDRGNRNAFRGHGSYTGGNSFGNGAVKANDVIGCDGNPAGRNMRSVLTIPTEAYPGAHFATFPRRLVEPCIRAGTSERGVCPACGGPWVRVVERNGVAIQTGNGWQQGRAEVGHHGPSRPGSFFPDSKTLGWRPSCRCEAGDPVPATILDPFAGSGTTLVVAAALGRHAIGCDLSRPYLDLARRRIERPHARTPRPATGRTEALPLFDRDPDPEMEVSDDAV